MQTRAIAIIAALAASVLAISQLVTLGFVVAESTRDHGVDSQRITQTVKKAIAKQAASQQRDSLSKSDVEAAVKKGMISFLKDRAGAGGNNKQAKGGQRAQPAPTTTQLPPVNGQSPILGPKDAPYTLVTYMDYDCPYCARMHTQIIPELRKRMGDKLRVVYRHRPLQMHGKSAKRAALGAECVAAIEGDDAFWRLTDALFQSRGSKSVEAIAKQKGWQHQKIATCISEQRYASRVRKDVQGAKKLSVQGTPTSFLMKTGADTAHRLNGAQPAAKIQQQINQLETTKEG